MLYWFHLYKAQEQVKVTYGARSQTKKGNLSDWKEAQWGNGVLLGCRLHRYVFFKTTHCAVRLWCELSMCRLFFHEKFKKLIRSPSEEAALSYPWPSIASHHQQRGFPTGVMNRVERQARFGPAKTLASRRYALQALNVEDTRNLEHTHYPVQEPHPRKTDRRVAEKK